jgi:hypothetical protein
MQIDGFDWDAGNLEKCSSHGVSRTEIESLFTRPHRVTPDVKHSGTKSGFWPSAIPMLDGRSFWCSRRDSMPVGC